ncbi:MAG: HD domain-containing protein [Clostridiales bacterium]|nr:HD domain-containing protein [Clostridiales bacterium]
MTTFYSIIKDIIRTEEFRKMKNYKHHIKGNLFEHSLKVAFLCYKYHKKKGMKISIEEFVRGALLHDYYLYDLHGDGKKHRFHWFKHPRLALENALKKYPDLTKTQQDMILHHMFPLTLVPPKTKAGWLVCYYDKVAAVNDRFRKRKKTYK